MINKINLGNKMNNIRKNILKGYLFSILGGSIYYGSKSGYESLQNKEHRKIVLYRSIDGFFDGGLRIIFSPLLTCAHLMNYIRKNSN